MEERESVILILIMKMTYFSLALFQGKVVEGIHYKKEIGYNTERERTQGCILLNKLHLAIFMGHLMTREVLCW